MRYLTETDLPDSELNHRLNDPSIQVELEIGIGIGRLFCAMASTHRNRFFVGVELKTTTSRVAALTASRKNLKNGVVINIEAHNYVRNWVSNDAFDVIHIYFPTPYPSAVDLSHRLITSQFIEDTYRILKPWGALRVVTDHRNYYEDICGFFPAKKWWSLGWQPLGLEIPSGYYVGTAHEVAFKAIYDAQIFALQVMRVG